MLLNDRRVILHNENIDFMEVTYCALARYNSGNMAQLQVLLLFPREPYQNRFILKTNVLII